jgi:hypothetical protein
MPGRPLRGPARQFVEKERKMGLNVNALKRCLGTGLVLSLLTPASVAFASDKRAQQPAEDRPDITLYGEAYSTWQLTATGNVAVDGRSVQTYDRLEHGSRIVVGAQSSARAEIKDVGRITIAPRTEVILDMVDNTIVAKMLEGAMKVEVAAKFATYVETPGNRIVSYPGAFASYRVKADPLAGTSVEKALGDVEVLAANDDDSEWDIDVPDGDTDYHVKANKTQTLRVEVERGDSDVANQPVVFAITTALEGASGRFTEGVQRITTTTDNDGVATVEFEAGAAQGVVYVEVFVPGTDAHETLHVYIDAKEKTFWNPTTTALYIALGAGAIAGTVIAINNRGSDDRNPNIIVNPPVVNP